MNKVVTLSADIPTLWRLQCKNLYSSANLAALAVRECLQNSLDAVRDTSKGKINITVSSDSIIVEDNGVGMSEDTIHNKFLTLGGTTKDNDSEVGGFGLAKSVILGCGTGFTVETQDNMFSDADLGVNPIHKVNYRQGTKITINQPLVSKDIRLSENTRDSLIQAIKDYVFTSRIPKNVSITLNGELKSECFQATESSHRLPAELGISNSMIPKNTKLTLNVFKNETSDAYLYVRLKGLTQFKTYLSWNAKCDVVLDIDTNISPRNSMYPFATNRESLKTQYNGIIDAIRDKISQAPISVAKDTRYKETLYENATHKQTRDVSTAVVSQKVCSVSKELTKIRDTVPQGGYVRATIADYISQYNQHIENAIKEENADVSKNQVVKSLPNSTLIKMNNPLKYSWLVYEDTYWEHKNIPLSDMLVAITTWEMILRTMCGNISNSDVVDFFPGIVLEDETMGLCLEKYLNTDKRVYVMFNPLMMPSNCSVQKLALWLMGVASHELAHYICGTFEAHGEYFSITRESIMNANLDSVDTIMELVKASRLHKFNQSSDYSKYTLYELEEIAIQNGLPFRDIKDKFPDKRIYRMRLVMALKKCNEMER